MPSIPYTPWILESPEHIAAWQWFVILLAGFLVVVFVVLKFARPVIQGMLNERLKGIVDAANQVDVTLRETEQMRNDYQERLERIEGEAEAKMADAVREAEVLREHILDEAQVAAEAIRRRGEEDVSQERAKALARLRAEFADGVVQAAGHAIGGSLDASLQSRLVGEFVRDVRNPS